MEKCDLEAIDIFLIQKQFKTLRDLAEHNLDMFFKIISIPEAGPILLRHKMIPKSLTTYQMLHLISDKEWSIILFKEKICTVLELRKYKESSRGIKRFFEKESLSINKLLYQLIYNETGPYLEENEVISHVLKNYTYYKEIPARLKIFIEYRSLKKNILKKLKKKQEGIWIAQSRTEYLKKRTLKTEDVIDYLIAENILNRTQLFSKNIYIYNVIRKRKKIKKRIAEIYPTFFNSSGCFKKTKLTTKELAEYFLEQVKNGQPRNYRTINQQRANFLLHNKKLWIVSLYVKITLDGIKSVLPLLLRKNLDEMKAYFQELEILPTSPEWLIYQPYFHLKCPEFCKKLARSRKASQVAEINKDVVVNAKTSTLEVT